MTALAIGQRVAVNLGYATLHGTLAATEIRFVRWYDVRLDNGGTLYTPALNVRPETGGTR